MVRLENAPWGISQWIICWFPAQRESDSFLQDDFWQEEMTAPATAQTEVSHSNSLFLSPLRFLLWS